MKVKANKKYLKYGLLALILTIIVPLFLDFFIIGNSFPSNISNSDWIIFLGSYLGSLIGSFTTLIGIIITLNFTRKQVNYDREFSQKQIAEERDFILTQTNEDRRLSLAPYLKYTIIQERTLLDCEYDIDLLHIVDRNYNTYVNTTIKIKNIGMGPVLDFKIYNITFNKELLGFTIDVENNILEKNLEWFMLIDIRIFLDEIKNETLIKMPPNSLFEYSPATAGKSGNLFFNIGYTDLVNNKYEQDIEVHMTDGCECKDNKWEYIKPILRLYRVGKSKIVNQ